MTLLQEKENKFSAMARFSDVSSLDVSTKTTNQKRTQRERGRVTVLFIVLIILVTFISVAVGITLSYVTRTGASSIKILNIDIITYLKMKTCVTVCFFIHNFCISKKIEMIINNKYFPNKRAVIAFRPLDY